MQGIESLPYEVKTQPLDVKGGIADYQQAAKMLAEFGREGDIYIVHAAEGETVVPLEVLQANPRMKNMIFKQMKDMGLEPERYIVGNQLNSLNPITGAPEFFFKKLWKGIKKVFKKLAPIVLPIVAPFLLPAMPLAFAAGLGSLTAGLATGQSFGDSLKGALITGGIAGAGNVLAGGKFLGTASNPTGGGISSLNKASKFGFKGATLSPSKIIQNAQGYGAALSAAKTSAGGVGGGGTINMIDGMPQGPVTSATRPISGGVVSTAGNVPSKEGFFTKYFSPNRSSIQPATKLAKAQAAAKEAGTVLTDDAVSKILTSSPSLVEKYTPLAVAGLGATALVNPKPEQPTMPETVFDGPSADELLRDDITSGRFQYAFDPAKFFGNNPFYQTQANTPTTMPTMVAGGGEIKGEGTSTSDSIPAMLSDGEFVFNAKAVRGLGNGDRKAGARKAYRMMKQLEAMA